MHENVVEVKSNTQAKHRIPVETPAKQPDNEPVSTSGKVKPSVQMARLLKEAGFFLRMRETDDALEANGKIVDNSFYDDILLHFYDEDFKNATICNAVVRREAKRNMFNPIHEYLKMCLAKYIEFGTDKDYVKEFCDKFKDKHTAIKYKDGTYKTVFHAFFYKWGIGAIGKSFNCKRNNPNEYWQNSVLLLGGEQGLGKSEFVAFLAKNIPDMYLEDQINPDNKELDRQLASHWVIEMSEAVTTFSKADQNQLKFKITQKKLSFRKPWDREITEKPNLASLIGTFNPDGVGIFSDTTGARRWHLCELQSIDWSYKELDIDLVWGQLYNDYCSGITNELSTEEKEQQQNNASEHRRELSIEDYIYRFFVIDKTQKNFYLHTQQIKDVVKEANYKFSNERALEDEIGKAMKALGLEKKKRDNRAGYCGIWYNPAGEALVNGSENIQYVPNDDVQVFR